MQSGSWLGVQLVTLSLASMFSNMAHEMGTAVLPLFLVAHLGGSAAVLGLIEAVKEAAASIAKLTSGWLSDRIARRRWLGVGGYALLASAWALFAAVTTWPQMLVLRAVGWAGRGMRIPVRESLLADAVEPHNYARAFSFNRAANGLGSTLGPLAALVLLFVWSGMHDPYRWIFLATLVPGVIPPLLWIVLVRDPRAVGRRRRLHTAVPKQQAEALKETTAAIETLPERFWFFCGAVALFRLGNFAPTLLALRAATTLAGGNAMGSAALLSVALYAGYSAVYSASSFPSGLLSEWTGKPYVLVLGYVAFGTSALVFGLAAGQIVASVIGFALAGVSMGFVESMESSVAADLLPPRRRGTGYGVLSAVIGGGGFFANLVVGELWTNVSAVAGFVYAAALAFTGAAALLALRLPAERGGRRARLAADDEGPVDAAI